MPTRPIDVEGLKRARRWMVRGFWVWGTALLLALPVAAVLGMAGAKLQQAGMPAWVPRVAGWSFAALLLVGGAFTLRGVGACMRATGSSRPTVVGWSLLFLLLLPVALVSHGQTVGRGTPRGLKRLQAEFDRLGLA